MRGYTTNYVNLIADNLRDRYRNGFPVLKELIQNADDARARSFVFGRHPGFPSSSHPLLRGSGLWFFNDGAFGKGDANGLRSFGIGGKAGDAEAIGKFGLGMKSVFHLCEAMFYVACDGRIFHCEGLTPWKQEGTPLHQEWDNIHDVDWDRLKDLGGRLAHEGAERRSWFLLWLPLRRKAHLRTPSGRKTGAILSRFPGDDPAGELAFLNDEQLAYDVAELLPLLRRLERVEHKGGSNSFVAKLNHAPRLLGGQPVDRTEGKVVLEGGHAPLAFSGLRARGEDGVFRDMMVRPEWPRIRYRDELGYEREAPDKALPEAAVVLCSAARGKMARSRLQWAVFLPVEDDCEDLGPGQENRAYSLVLHGQFFLDAGRRKIHDLECLHADAERLAMGPVEESLLRRTWNQRLAQNVLLPLVPPALERHVTQEQLSDDECASLTETIARSGFFGTFRRHICRDGTWVRTLQHDDGPRWCLVEGDRRACLRPLPKPPASAPERPWKVLPELNACDVVPYDVGAPSLSPSGTPREWPEEELERLLSRVDGLLVDAPSTDYLSDFLEVCAGSQRDSEQVQYRLLVAIRAGFLRSGSEDRRRMATKAKRLVSFLRPEKRLEIASDLSESILGQLWRIDVPLLLVPRGMNPEPSDAATPDEETLAAWLGVLDRALDSLDGSGAQKPILDAIQGLLRALPDEARRRFLRRHPSLRVVAVREARNGADKPMSIRDLDRLSDGGTLFRFAAGLRSAAMGIAPRLARAIPDADVCLVRTQEYREISADGGLPEGRHPIPLADDAQACLAAVGRYSGRLGDLSERRDLLERANDPGNEAIALRGLRYLLHGSRDHRLDANARLWIGRHEQHPAWSRLWTATHSERHWSLVPEELAIVMPRTRWALAGIAEVDPRTLIGEMRTSEQTIDEPTMFSREERDEILSRIDDEDLWRRLPLHTTVDGRPATAEASAFLASSSPDPEDPLTRRATLIAPSGNAETAARQRRWLRPLDDAARMELALRAEDPARYWRSIMDALNRTAGDIPGDLAGPLRSTAWLPTSTGAPVKPEDVIDLRETLQDQARRLVAEHRTAKGPGFAVPRELNAAVQAHEAWPRIRKIGFSSGPNGLDRLGLLLKDLPNYHIGTWSIQPPRAEEAELLARHGELPGWRLLQAAAGSVGPEDAWTRLGPILSQPIGIEKLAKVLAWLSGDSDRWPFRKSVHDLYLRQLARYGRSAASVLPRLRLAAADGTWRKPTELCAGAHGIEQAGLLDARQEAILGDLVYRADARPTGDQANTARLLPEAEFGQYRGTVLDDLRNYFRPWDSGLVPRPMIGVVLALLGPTLRDLAEEYLHPHSFDWFVGQLPWRDPGRTRERIEWMGGMTAREALELIEAGVEVLTGDRVEVFNLLGSPIEIPLDQNPASLLAGHLNWQGLHCRYGVMVSLRCIDPDRFEPERFGDQLRATAERLYADLYNQQAADFASLWSELDQSDQLEIEIARRLILDHVPFYLRQLPLRSKSIKEQLEACDRLRRRIVEAETDGGGPSVDCARKKWRKAVDDLADGIARSPDQQQAVALAVKRKLDQYQYDLSGIPFELFQNADDAAIELGQIRAYPGQGCQVPEGARRFVVEEHEDGLGFQHWGRLVNARGPVGFNGEGRGFDRDLEKMLLLSATDKAYDQGLTGQFGLGFKSVLLACEQPRVLSGRLAIRVVAGMLPQPWEEAHEERRRLNNHSTDPGLPGTFIDLPGVAGDQQRHLLSRFRHLAGILCVFGRAVRTIERVGPADETILRWQPREICPRVEIGELDLQGDWGERTWALCLRTDAGSVLIAIGPDGFRPLPDTVPTLWVTAPTRESTSVGFAVNGAFELDAGRSRLAGDSDSNRKKARRIGRQAGAALGTLLKRSHKNWAAVRADLGLAANIDALDFWESLWSGLTRRCLRARRGSSEGLAREVALGALARLCDWDCSVPNGLKGPLRQFTDASAIRYELGGLLLRDDVATELAAWERFSTKFPGRKCVSDAIARILKEAIPKTLQPLKPLGLSALVGLLGRSRVQPADAGVLGRLLHFTHDAEEWMSKDLNERLKVLTFRSEANAWVGSRKLLTGGGRDLKPDEPRRHALAPPEYRLHPDYHLESGGALPAVAFFLRCRQGMEARTERIADWILGAVTTEARRIALAYLADGELGERVATHVRERGWLRAALEDPQLLSGLTGEQCDRLRRRLIPKAFLEQVIVQTGAGGQERIDPLVELPIALDRVYRWWADEGHGRVAAYRNRIYPRDQGALNFTAAPAINAPARSSWFTLLALGSFQSIGRTQDVQHRGFIQRCRHEGWWDVFTECDPAGEPEKWMDVIEQYAEAQHDDEEWAQWLAQFPKLYRLRRWLDAYVELFLSIDLFRKPFQASEILAPRSNPHFQGGGIEAPPLTQTLKAGFPFVVRELLHHGVIGNKLAVPHAYAPTEGIKRLFRSFGWEVSTSEEIYGVLAEPGHLGPERAAFGGSYDIPLRIVSADAALQRQLFGSEGASSG